MTAGGRLKSESVVSSRVDLASDVGVWTGEGRGKEGQRNERGRMDEGTHTKYKLDNCPSRP